MAALRSRCGHYIFVLWFLSLSFLLFPPLVSVVAMCCTRLAGNAGPKIAKKSPSAHRHTNLSGYKPIFATKACVDNQKETC